MRERATRGGGGEIQEKRELAGQRGGEEVGNQSEGGRTQHRGGDVASQREEARDPQRDWGGGERGGREGKGGGMSAGGGGQPREKDRQRATKREKETAGWTQYEAQRKKVSERERHKEHTRKVDPEGKG